MKALLTIGLTLSAIVLPSLVSGQPALREGTYRFEIHNSQERWSLKLVLDGVERIPTYSGEHLLYAGKLIESYSLSSGKLTEYVIPIEAEGAQSVVIGKPGTVRNAILSKPNWETWATGFYYDGGWKPEANTWVGTLRLHESDPFGKRDVKLFPSSVSVQLQLSMIRIPEGNGIHVYYTDVQEDVTRAQTLLHPDDIFPELDPDILCAFDKLQGMRVLPYGEHIREPSAEVLLARLEYKAEQILRRQNFHFQLWRNPPQMLGGTMDINRPPNGVDYTWDPTHARCLYLAMAHKLQRSFEIGNGYHLEQDYLHGTHIGAGLLWLTHFVNILADFDDLVIPSEGIQPNPDDYARNATFFSLVEASIKLLEDHQLYFQTRGQYEMARVPALELAQHNTPITRNDYYRQVRDYLEQLCWSEQHRP